MTSPRKLPAWLALQEHFEHIKTAQMRDMFKSDSSRFDKFSLRLNDILFDYSKNKITDETLKLLVQLAKESDVFGWIKKMFQGEEINHTEHRPVLHTALRHQPNTRVGKKGQDVMPDVQKELKHIETFCESVRTRKWLGVTGQPITDVVNIGIGGSDRGPVMAAEALLPYGFHDIKLHFVSNVDENQILDTLDVVKPETTLFIISSKSFTTVDTMLNAQSAKAWFCNSIKDNHAIARHFVAVSSNIKAAEEFGINKENIFAMWDWVGGRFSIWSAIGLPVAIYIGMANFKKFLQGAYEVDEHFQQAPMEQNIPVIMALLGIWYNNFFNARSHVILPYDQHLHKFPAYLQQADMESNGKSIDRNGHRVNYNTGPVVFGEIGISAQHAFYQLLHQGTKFVPADFLAPITNFRSVRKHHRALMSNVFAQAEALMKGKNEEEVRKELEAENLSQKEIENLLPYKVFSGNKPTNTILFDTLDPKTLGSLIALYEHKIFVQGIIWNINSFDQWGVELGKQLASTVLSELDGDDEIHSHDASTNGLINHYKYRRTKVKNGGDLY